MTRVTFYRVFYAKLKSISHATMNVSLLQNVLNDMTQIYINAHNMTSNVTKPSYKAPVMHPVSVILCLLLALICVIIYGGSALLEFYAKLQQGNRHQQP